MAMDPRWVFPVVITSIEHLVQAIYGLELGPVLIGVVAILCGGVAVPELAIAVINALLFTLPG